MHAILAAAGTGHHDPFHFRDHDLCVVAFTYVTTFTADGIIDVGNGAWLFAGRRIHNKGNEAWATPPGNPAWQADEPN